VGLALKMEGLMRARRLIYADQQARCLLEHQREASLWLDALLKNSVAACLAKCVCQTPCPAPMCSVSKPGIIHARPASFITERINMRDRKHPC